MTLTDAGPLIALADRNDPSHERCVQVLPDLTAPLMTTLPVLTEAMYFLWREIGWAGQEHLWSLVIQRRLQLAPFDEEAFHRMHLLMKKYQDTPMDFADASLVVAAETLATRHIFTLDSHFYAYRLNNGRTFEVFPTP